MRLSTFSFTLASSSANSSASRTMRSISSSDRRPFSAVMVIFSVLPAPVSSAATWSTPLASISNVTSICGTPRGGGDAVQFEFAQQVVVLGHGSLAFVHLDHHGRLVVLVRGERLRLLGGNNRVTFDELSHHSAHSLNAEGQGCHVEQQNVLHIVATFATEDAALHCSAVRHGLVRVDAAVRFLAVEEVLEQLLHLGDTSGPANHHELVDLALGQATVVHHALHRAQCLLEEVHVELLETRAGQGLGEVDAVVQRL